ncbi:hypothetical protein ACL1IT_09825 [Corynebacterium striatum]|uniref:Uncharacterized protein n=1 Tax=Corynebacterium striatum TaxID=43770 RepID=A0ABC8CKL7_CORST|nr:MULTISPECIES: hypothetical protein [Corynebacterium]ATZ08369.1 hypothetical protein A9D01_05895 [Corynebacterium striatum]EGT5576532.1 hypothetical protein [Corynebacterium striatum]EGT5613626.1 hypothetical protein [Corynebacterium striatum]EGT5788630.1 hypothetical protein [Corynebacterium striatum]KAA1263861.1 hypothetical protein D7S42_09280 [Corynebacterium striatum]
MYSQFNRSVHHNVARQIEIAVSADIGSRGNAIETYEVGIRTAVAVGAAAFSLKEFPHLTTATTLMKHRYICLLTFLKVGLRTLIGLVMVAS